MRSPFHRSLFVQLGVAITVFVFLIEGALFVGSYQSKKKELYADKLHLEQVAKDPKSFEMTEADIDEKLQMFSRNIALMVLGIIAVVVLGTLAIFYQIAGKHILRMRRLNREGMEEGRFLYFPEEDLPPNEVGDVIRTRNKILKELENYQSSLEDSLDDTKNQLQQAAKLSAIGEMTASVAHDLKNPLTIIFANVDRAEMAAKKTPPDLEKHQKAIEKTRFGLERIHRLVDRMNRFGRTQFNLQDGTPLKAVADNALALLEGKAQKAGVTVDVRLPAELTAWADINSLEQVLMNLISNSIDALEGQPKKEVYVLAEIRDQKVHLMVKDTGPGIPEDVQQNLFTPFFTTKEEGKGTGLGLSICQQIAERHQGVLTVDSSPQKGTTFTLELWGEAPAQTLKQAA